MNKLLRIVVLIAVLGFVLPAWTGMAMGQGPEEASPVPDESPAKPEGAQSGPSGWIAAPGEVYVDPLYHYELDLVPGWYVSPTDPSALFGVAMIYSYDPNALAPDDGMPTDGVKIQIGVGDLGADRSLEEWVARRVADQTGSEYGLLVAMQASAVQRVSVGRHVADAFVLQSNLDPAVLEIDLATAGQVMSIGVTPADSENMATALSMLSTLEVNGAEEIAERAEGTQALTPDLISELQSSINSGSIDGTCPYGTFAGGEASSSPIALWMPFLAGETWAVGGSGSFYGNGAHCNSNNDYYATDWNRSGDDGAKVLPVANGTISAYDDPPCPTTGYGCFVQVDHSSGMRTRYAHLSAVYRTSGSVNHWDQIGAVGSSGNSTSPHLHLSFWKNNGGYFSRCYNNGSVCPNGEAGLSPQSPRPSPMGTTSGAKTLEDYGSYVSNNASGTVSVTSAWTADGSGNTKSTFTAGQPIRYYGKVNNTTGWVQTASFVWKLVSPCYVSTTLWSGSLDTGTGFRTWYLSRTTPTTCPGKYTYTMTVSYGGTTTSKTVTFQVVGK